MIKLRKFFAIIYFLAYVLLVGGLAFHWFGISPISDVIEAHGNDLWLNYAILILILITLIGVLITLVRTLSLRSKNSFQSSSNDLGIVQISRGAIVYEVEKVVEAHEDEVKLMRTNVEIKNRRNPTAKIAVRVAPRSTVAAPEIGSTLQREIKEAVEHLTGNEVRSVVIDVRKAMETKPPEEEDKDEGGLFNISFGKKKKEAAQSEGSEQAPGDQPDGKAPAAEAAVEADAEDAAEVAVEAEAEEAAEVAVGAEVEAEVDAEPDEAVEAEVEAVAEEAAGSEELSEDASKSRE